MGSQNHRSSDPFGDDDQTVVDDRTPADFDTPVTMPRCVDCGRVVFFDDFTVAASIVAVNLFSADRCVRAKDGHWRWCGERWRLVYIPPR